MSYNITSFKVKNLHLELPCNFDFTEWVKQQPEKKDVGTNPASPWLSANVGRRWLLDENPPSSVVITSDETWQLWIMDVFKLHGEIQDDKLITNKLEMSSSVGSGVLYQDALLPLFEEFKGDLNALVVWEGGESVQRLTIEEGVIKEEVID